MRTGILHYTSPPIVGGVEQLMATHARLLLDDGHEVVVLAGRGGSFDRRVRLRKLPLLDSKHPRVVDAAEQFATGEVPSSFGALVDDLHRGLTAALSDLDVCFVHNAFTLHFNLALTTALDRIAREGLATHLVAWCHDLAWTNPLYTPLLYAAPPWDLLRTATPAVEYVVVSEDRRADLSRLTGLPPERISVIPAGIEPGRKLALRESTVALLRRYRLLEADPFLLLPVRITKRKNIQYALRVLGSLRSTELGRDARLVVTGPPGPHNVRSGDYVDELRSLRRELGLEEAAVFFFEEHANSGRPLRVTDALMDELYRAADLLLFPSEQEGFGIPMLEAGIAGVPIFCADIPPFREIAGSAAHFFQLDDPPVETARRIDAFCREDRRYRLRKDVMQQFSWSNLYRERIAPLLPPRPFTHTVG